MCAQELVFLALLWLLPVLFVFCAAASPQLLEPCRLFHLMKRSCRLQTRRPPLARTGALQREQCPQPTQGPSLGWGPQQGKHFLLTVLTAVNKSRLPISSPFWFQGDDKCPGWAGVPGARKGALPETALCMSASSQLSSDPKTVTAPSVGLAPLSPW